MRTEWADAPSLYWMSCAVFYKKADKHPQSFLSVGKKLRELRVSAVQALSHCS
jgi:hypothetical protein